MREMMLLAAGIVVIGGATFILMRGNTVRQFQVATAGEKPAEKKAAASTANGSSKLQSKRARSRARERAAETEIPNVWVEVPAEYPSSPRTELRSDRAMLPSLPEARDIPSGMPRSEVEKLYGRPTLSTIQTRSGRLLQRYVYISRDKSTATVAVLEDGRVITALNVPQ